MSFESHTLFLCLCMLKQRRFSFREASLCSVPASCHMDSQTVFDVCVRLKHTKKKTLFFGKEPSSQCHTFPLSISSLLNGYYQLRSASAPYPINIVTGVVMQQVQYVLTMVTCV